MRILHGVLNHSFQSRCAPMPRLHLRDRTESDLDGAHLSELGGEVVKERWLASVAQSAQPWRLSE